MAKDVLGDSARDVTAPADDYSGGYDHKPCCTACNGAGTDMSGPCFDCYGTGHTHAPDSQIPEE